MGSYAGNYRVAILNGFPQWIGENLFDQLGAVPISRASLFYLAGQWLLRPLRGLAFARRHGGGCAVL